MSLTRGGWTPDVTVGTLRRRTDTAFSSKMSDSEASTNSESPISWGQYNDIESFAESPEFILLTRSYCPDDFGRQHPEVVAEVFYTMGVTSREVHSAAGFESTEPALFHAVCDNDFALVEKLLIEKHDPNVIFQMKTEFQGKNRSYTQYPLHRAVQTGNKDLVDILLKHGGDPNCRNGQEKTPLRLLFRVMQLSGIPAGGGRPSDSDRVIAEMLLRAGAYMTLDFGTFGGQILKDILSGSTLIDGNWTWLEMLVTAGTNANVRKHLIEKCRNYVGDHLFVFFNLVTKCGEPDSNGKCGYDILDSCLKAGLAPRVLRHGLQLAVDHVVPRAVLLLIKAGANVNFEYKDRQGKLVTPFLLALNQVTATVDNISKRSIWPDFLLASHVIYACRYIDSEFSILLLLAKSGAISTWSRDVGCRLVQIEVALRSAYEAIDRLFREQNWSLEDQSAAQNHLQRCLDNLQAIKPSNLLDLCCVAVRQALGPGLEDKLKQLGLPVTIRDCMLHDLQDIVDGIAPCEWPGSELHLSIRRSLLSGDPLDLPAIFGMDICF